MARQLVFGMTQSRNGGIMLHQACEGSYLPPQKQAAAVSSLSLEVPGYHAPITSVVA